MAASYEAVVAKIDAYRARKVGEMLITHDDPEFRAIPRTVLLDLEPLDAKELAAKFYAKQTKFGTVPFDPEGKVLRLYPGGVTIWSGFPGAGKTTLLRQLICHILARGSSCFLATLEEDPSDALCRLAGTAAGHAEPTPDDIAWFIDTYAKRFRLWGVIGIAEHLELLAVVRQLAGQGIRHAVIDSLMCLDVANDDFEGQRRFANLLAATARAAKIHIHLVAHPRKLISADQEPDLNDVAGARELGGMADNVIFVRRSKGESTDPSAEQTPMTVAIKKQRHHTGHVGMISGWYQRRFRQFSLDQYPAAPKWYLPEEARAQ